MMPIIYSYMYDFIPIILPRVLANMCVFLKDFYKSLG